MKLNGERINLRFMDGKDVLFKVKQSNDPDINKFIGLTGSGKKIGL